MVNINDVVTIVAEYLPDNYTVSGHATTKNNGVKRNGILINGGEVVSPIIYVDDLINEEFSAEEIAVRVVEQYKEAKEKEIPLDINEISDYSEMKEKICYRLINMKANEEMLKNVPYEQINNELALVYFLDLGIDATITVTNALADVWGVSSKELYGVAKDNTPLLYPPNLKSMTDTMIDLMGNDIEMMKIQFGKTDLDDDGFRDFLKQEVIGEEVPLYVLRGRETYGATALIYDDMIAILHERFGDAYVIPSSIHEVLIVPVDLAKERNIYSNEIKTLVEQVNETTVSPEERLSDNVFVITKDGLVLAEEKEDEIKDDAGRW